MLSRRLYALNIPDVGLRLSPSVPWLRVTLVVVVVTVNGETIPLAAIRVLRTKTKLMIVTSLSSYELLVEDGPMTPQYVVRLGRVVALLATRSFWNNF